MKQYSIDVYIADNHTMFNEGLKEAINRSESIHVSHTFTSLKECEIAFSKRCPDVLLLDISMPDGDSGTFCQWIRKEYPKVKIVAVTIHDEYSVIQRMIESGVHGYILKSSPVEELTKAIYSVWQGQPYFSTEVEEIIEEGKKNAVILTSVEQNILRQICNGYTNPQIAASLKLSTETINWYRKRLLAKYGVKNTVSLVNLVMKEKLI